MDSGLVQQFQPCGWRLPLMNEMRVQRFQVGQAHQLRDIGLVADVALVAGVFIAPLFRGFAEQRHVQQVCLAGIDEVDLPRGE